MEDPGVHEGVWVYVFGIGNSLWSSKNGLYYGEIKKGTEGQYTGLKDKNNKEIFKGDIIQSKSELVLLMTNKPTGRFQIENYEVKWEKEKGRWGSWKSNKFEPFGLKQSSLTKWYKIIGNIYENPELREP